MHFLYVLKWYKTSCSPNDLYNLSHYFVLFEYVFLLYLFQPPFSNLIFLHCPSVSAPRFEIAFWWTLALFA